MVDDLLMSANERNHEKDQSDVESETMELVKKRLMGMTDVGVGVDPEGMNEGMRRRLGTSFYKPPPSFSVSSSQPLSFRRVYFVQQRGRRGREGIA